jgi:alkyl sulfatase BDS1-like metallo-beta-lactamase superfamily hydrolase
LHATFHDDDFLLTFVCGVGSAVAILCRGRKAFDAGDYRPIADPVKQVVMSEPNGMETCLLRADVLERFACHAENDLRRHESEGFLP